MLALEARQLVWRQDAASRAGAPDSAPDAVGDLMSSSHAMLEAISTLRAQCAERCRRPEQVDVFVERGVVFARAYFDDDDDVEEVTFDQPWGFRRSTARELFEEALNVR
jgi:hypothetical protein